MIQDNFSFFPFEVEILKNNKTFKLIPSTNMTYVLHWSLCTTFVKNDTACIFISIHGTECETSNKNIFSKDLNGVL